MNPKSFAFPTMDEVELFRARIRAFILAAVFAAIPFAFSWIWHLLDGAPVTSAKAAGSTDGSIAAAATEHFLGVPDLAFAGVVFAIAALTNSTFSFTKLSGWKSSSWMTFTLLAAAVVSSIACFVVYLRSVYGTAGADEGLMILAAGVMSGLTLLSSLISQFTFVQDELESARNQINRIEQ